MKITPMTDQSIEKKLNQLQQIVTAMEQEALSLEDSLQAFEQGMQLSKECQAMLDSAEQRIKHITSAKPSKKKNKNSSVEVSVQQEQLPDLDA